MYTRQLLEERAKARPAAKPRRPLNLQSAKRITVLFPADNADERKVIDRWRDEHKRAGRKIRVLAYFAEDIGSTNFNFRTLTVKDLNWYGVPSGGMVDEFRKESCELLIRLGPVEHPVLDFLATINGAPLKVGPYLPEAETPYQLQYDALGSPGFRDQLDTIENIFSYTNCVRQSVAV